MLVRPLCPPSPPLGRILIVPKGRRYRPAGSIGSLWAPKRPATSNSLLFRSDSRRWMALAGQKSVLYNGIQRQNHTFVGKSNTRCPGQCIQYHESYIVTGFVVFVTNITQSCNQVFQCSYYSWLQQERLQELRHLQQERRRLQCLLPCP